MRNVLTVFIASPSDLAAEREKTFAVADELNKAIKQLDWSIDLLGWEDTLPGAGRPQAIINRDVQRCDLFIGLLFRRWGTPPANGSQFSSGFEEEFAIARDRHENTSSPEIWMFFKRVEPEQIADAGIQLQRVIKFRKDLIASKALLFKEFDSVNDWEKMLRICLLQHVLGIAHAPRAAPEGPSDRAAPSVPSLLTEQNTADAPAAGLQLASLARSLEPAFKTGDLSEVTKALDTGESTFLAVRGLLLSAALVSASGSSATPLPTHELNTLYQYRARLQATDDELYLLFKTILADNFDVTPGWYWFRDHGIDKATWQLILVALFGDDTKAQLRSFEILRRAQVSMFTEVRHEVLQRRLREVATDLRDAAWAYLVDVTTPKELKLLQEWAPGTWLESRVQWLRAWIETGRHLDAFLPKIPDPQLIPEPMKQAICASIPQMPDGSLQALRPMPISELRETATAELRRRGIPISDDDSARDAGGLGLAQILTSLQLSRGSPGLSADGIENEENRYERLNHENSASLRNSLDWYGTDGPTSYRLLIERGEIARELARKDLSERFQRIRDESDQRLEAFVGSELAAKQAHKFEKFRELIAREYTAAVLTTLATDPTLEDLSTARHLLNDSLARSAALRIVASKGDAKDVNDLIEIARSTFGGERKLALEAVQKLTSDRLETAKMLLALGGRDMQIAALSLVRDLPHEDAIPFLEQLLSHDDGNLRVAAVGQLRKRVDFRTLARMLGEYTSQKTYYYNVVAWLDRLIYAPEPIWSYYETELNEKLEAFQG